MATPEEKTAINAAILENIASEAEARHLQQKLISLPGLDTSDIAKVKEISGDEVNHALVYEAMYKKYSGISAAPDGMAEAVAALFGKKG